MANLNVNKVIYGGDVLIDLTGDSVSADKILKGITAHDKSGAKITGTCTFDSDTSEDTAAVAEILVGKTAHARGSKLTGTMKNNGAVKGTISTVAGEYTVPQGYHDGSGNFTLAYNALVMAMQEFQRIFQRNNMFLLGFVNFINNTGKGSRFSASGRAGYKNHTFSAVAQMNDMFRNTKLFRVRQMEGNDSDHC